MSTALAIRFPLGRYHANPWDRAVNEGATEWPPSPWRIHRALVATWHTRWPDLTASTLDGLLDALADPPCYRTPRTVPGHSRHYYPNLDHKRGLSDGKRQRPKQLENDPSGKDMTLDPFLSVTREEELLVCWDATLDAGQRQVLAKLAELLPYLGRSESVCEARLLDEHLAPGQDWWHPDPGGETRLLAVTRPVSRTTLEASTTDVRRRHRTLPTGTRWVSYATGSTPPAPVSQREKDEQRDITAIRFAVMGQVPMMATHGVLLADRAHEVAGTALRQGGNPDARRQEIMGTRGAGTDHAHAHWIALPESAERGATVRNLVIWCPSGLRTKEVQALLTLRELSGHRGNYQITGFPDLQLRFQAAGTIQQVAPELCGPSRWWRSLTPYLPVRHRKNETLDEYVTADVAAELRYRDKPPAQVSRLEPGAGMTDRWASEYRRRRTGEPLARESTQRARPRPGMGLRLEFGAPLTGPLVLGQLSHFGFGIFIPDRRLPQIMNHVASHADDREPLTRPQPTASPRVKDNSASLHGRSAASAGAVSQTPQGALARSAQAASAS